MKTLKRNLAVVLAAVMIAGVMAVAKPAKTEAMVGNQNLGSLIVLDGLFGNNNAAGLAGLIAVDNVTGGGSIAEGGINGNSLGDLIVLNGLFNGGGFGGNNLGGLAGLIAISNLTGSGF